MSEIKSRPKLKHLSFWYLEYLLIKLITLISLPFIQYEHWRQIAATSPLFTTVRIQVVETDDMTSSRWEKRLVQPVEFRKLTFYHYLVIVALPLTVCALVLVGVCWLI